MCNCCCLISFLHFQLVQCRCIWVSQRKLISLGFYGYGEVWERRKTIDSQRPGERKYSGQTKQFNWISGRPRKDAITTVYPWQDKCTQKLNGDGCWNVAMNCFNPVKLVAIPGKMSYVTVEEKCFVNENAKELSNRWRRNFRTIQHESSLLIKYFLPCVLSHRNSVFIGLGMRRFVACHDLTFTIQSIARIRSWLASGES